MDRYQNAAINFKNYKQAYREQALELGYELDHDSDGRVKAELDYKTSWTQNGHVRTYHEPTLTAHETKTAEQLQSFDHLATKYTITVWSENEDMSNLFEQFTKDVSAIV